MPRNRKLIRALRAERPARPKRPLRAERTPLRRRRDPATARQELLDAAERVFALAHPDRVGLKTVAREAGVSHALITHYFGTYAGLVEATLERRIRALRERIFERLKVAAPASLADEMLDLLFDTLEDPVHLRLVKWLIASERPGANTAFALRERGIQQIARQVVEALAPAAPVGLIAIVELAMVTAVAAAYGYAISKHALAASLGRDADRELDRRVRATLSAMIQGFVRDRLPAGVAVT